MTLFKNSIHVSPAYFYDSQKAKIFSEPAGCVQAHSLSDVVPCLDELQILVENEGLYAAGFVSYEAGSAFDKSFPVRDSSVPLLWFGVYRKCADTQMLTLPSACGGDDSTCNLELLPDIDSAQYAAGFEHIKRAIKDGDTYQVNYTFPLAGNFRGNMYQWFYQRAINCGAEYCMFLDAANYAIASLSPELFFRIDGNRIITRPMKGTRMRGLWPQADEELRQELVGSQKDRAENLMIVDLLRNDLGRICEPGSIEVSDLCAVEKYPTVWQMVSQVTGQTCAGYADIFRALFPCGSVTGAPKSATMKIIHEIEPQSRGVYCGAAGWMAPGRQAVFNVPIRTLCIDKRLGRAVYGVGGGIVWDSEVADEYAECLTKSRVLNTPICRNFQLLETLLYENGDYFLLDEHLSRLLNSAEYFGFTCDIAVIKRELLRLGEDFDMNDKRVRLTLGCGGDIDVTYGELLSLANNRAVIAPEPVDCENVLLYHKTTNRGFYTHAAREKGDASHVILYNRIGEVTESDIANIVIEKGGQKITPPLRCGLLDGVMRRHLLDAGEIVEGVVTFDVLRNADRIWLINSVRKWLSVAVDFDNMENQP